MHGSDHRPVAVVYFHRRWGAAVGTGQGETMNVDEFHGGKKKTNSCVLHRVAITTIVMEMRAPVYNHKPSVEHLCRERSFKQTKPAN